MPFENNDIIAGFDTEKDDGIKIRLELVDDKKIIIVHLRGLIDTYSSHFFSKQMNMVIELYNKIIFDFSELNYLSSTGIGCFTNILKEVKLRNGNISFTGVIPKVYEVFSLLGFTSFFNFSPSYEDSIKFLSSENYSPKNLFPVKFKCPICDKNLSAKKDGRFKCPNCKTIIAVDEKAKVYLG